jgi:hypothetical protein
MASHADQRRIPARLSPQLQVNTLWDGIFHASTYMFVVVGLILLWQRAKRRVKHYSIRTAEAYAHWIKRFILFRAKHHPPKLAVAHPSHCCTQDIVSTQNQARSEYSSSIRKCCKKNWRGWKTSCAPKRPNVLQWYSLQPSARNPLAFERHESALRRRVRLSRVKLSQTEISLFSLTHQSDELLQIQENLQRLAPPMNRRGGVPPVLQRILASLRRAGAFPAMHPASSLTAHSGRLTGTS